MNDIWGWFEGRSVFITGATGFVGKVVLEKLLFSCNGIRNIYILIRNNEESHSGSNIRFEKLLQSKAFDRIREKDASLLSKIVPICGDITQPKLGISFEDEQTLIETASIVIHSAATVKFNQPFKTAILINVIGTKRVFDLFKKFSNKDAFIHVSTAFSNCHVTNIQEKVYPHRVSADFLIESHDQLDTEAYDNLFETLSEGRPNTYTLTKALAESYLEQNADGLPVAIVRPPMVLNAFEEPSTGWADTSSLVANTLHVIGLGLIHNLPVNGAANFNVLPVDFISRILIAVTWFTSLNKSSNSKKLKVYNCISDKHLKFNQFLTIAIQYCWTNPSTFMMSYPHISFTNNPLLLKFGMYFNHYLPALALDILRMAKGKGPKYVNLYRKFFFLLPMKTYFMKQEFIFENENVKSLYKELSESDKQVFNFDTSSFPWELYVTRWLDGMRQFFYPNEKNNRDEALRKLRMLYWRRILVNAFLGIAALLLCGVLVYRISSLFNSVAY